MARAQDLVYRKTADGQAELAQRRHGLGPRARGVLVMVNGVDPLQRLIERLGPEVLETLALLRQHGLIEAIAQAEQSAARAPRADTAAPHADAAGPPLATAAVVRPEPASPPPAAPAPPALDPARHRAAAQALVALLLPFFGPDAPRIAETALRARSVAEFNQGVGEVADRLAIHLGRRKAAEATDRLRL
jgi:hypothetical protein